MTAAAFAQGFEVTVVDDSNAKISYNYEIKDGFLVIESTLDVKTESQFNTVAFATFLTQ